MAKVSVRYQCSACGASTPRWVGRCPKCQEFGTVSELAPVRAGATATAPVRAARPVSEIAAADSPRRPVGLPEFDRVIGGGLVAGQVVLVAGEPGVGKSTLLLWVADLIARRRVGNVLYISGEESAEQIGVRARRINADSDTLLIADESDLAAVIGHIESSDPRLVVIDSIQTISSAELDGRAGGVSQVIEVTTALARVAKSRGMPMLIVGQSTKESTVAGPRALEHLVDTVLTFEGDRHTSLRLLRTSKNRYGPADEVACFEQTEFGLAEVSDPSALFRGMREVAVPGTCVTVTVEGRRAILAEIQTLMSTASGPPRRGVTGLDSSRVAMLIALTEATTKTPLNSRDVFVATVGGARIVDPAADLAICMALWSQVTGAPIPMAVAAIGEVALSGDVRPVSMLGQRVAEAARAGYKTILVPPGSRERMGDVPAGVTVNEIPHVKRALDRLDELRG
jgi:DNA repair protein RadA/Sms